MSGRTNVRLKPATNFKYSQSLLSTFAIDVMRLVPDSISLQLGISDEPATAELILSLLCVAYV